MVPLQIIIILFALFAFSRLVLRRRERVVTLGEFIFWSAIWIGIITVAIYPDILKLLADTSGIGRAIDLLIYTSIIALFYSQFRQYVKIEKQGQDITRLVRQIALQRAPEHKSRPHKRKRDEGA